VFASKDLIESFMIVLKSLISKTMLQPNKYKIIDFNFVHTVNDVEIKTEVVFMRMNLPA
jgi:hypothetical protein